MLVSAEFVSRENKLRRKAKQPKPGVVYRHLDGAELESTDERLN